MFPSNLYWNSPCSVLLKYQNGAVKQVWFSTRYRAELFIGAIPQYMQQSSELEDLVGAIIEPGTIHLN